MKHFRELLQRQKERSKDLKSIKTQLEELNKKILKRKRSKRKCLVIKESDTYFYNLFLILNVFAIRQLFIL